MKIDAISRDFRKYDQVEKSHTYRLAEHAGDDFDDDYQIAILDFEPFLKGDEREKATFANGFCASLEEIGFAVLVGHGVEQKLYDDSEEATFELFNSTSLDEKLNLTAGRYGSINQGYFPLEKTTEIHPDLVEAFVFCRRAFDIAQKEQRDFRATDYWPSAMFEQQFRKLVVAHEALFKPIARAMLQGLGCEPTLLDRKLTRTNFGLRLNHYPPMTPAQANSGAARLLGHEDVDLFTILPAARTDGLQVWNHRSSRWVRLVAPPGAIIINTGDYMQRISNDRLRSTTHRVGKPTDRSHLKRARVSFPTNVYLWEDEILEVLPGLGTPRYEPIKAIHFHTRSTSKFYGDDYALDVD